VTAVPVDHLTRAQIRTRLRAHRPPAAAPDRPGEELPGAAPGVAHPAAVLLPLFREQDAWHLLFIRRAERERDLHSGQVGFPGGRGQPEDPDYTATALREAREEIGLPPHRVWLLGRLRPLLTVSRYVVTPVVGQIPWPQPLIAEPREVARIFSIPLAWLADPRHHQVRTYPAPGHPQARDLIFFDEYDGECLWGVTARLTLDFLACLGHRESRSAPAPTG
jgi:8-oxo-dGTP pyrophosphatase MutT (NUDIX family)